MKNLTLEIVEAFRKAKWLLLCASFFSDKCIDLKEDSFEILSFSKKIYQKSTPRLRVESQKGSGQNQTFWMNESLKTFPNMRRVGLPH